MPDEWLSVCLASLACWVLVSGVDDFLIDLAWLYTRYRPRLSGWPALQTAVPEREIAVFVPLWREHAVIGRMLDHNLDTLRYRRYRFFIGVYPNDPLTEAAVRAACARDSRLTLAFVPHPGPTSKADCLNALYRALLAFERAAGTRFAAVVTHDAEDLIHADSLASVNALIADFDMVQMPVLPLRAPGSGWTHALYCDEFAEAHVKDIPVRQRLGGFVPGAGVGTAFSRAVLERLAERSGGNIFDARCLTEDYENGFRIHALGHPQIFLPALANGTATRELFPRAFRAAVRQRTRWITGIALQSWERHGWRAARGQAYWFWRDRKPLIGNLLAPAANLLSGYGAITAFYCACAGVAWPLAEAYPLLTALSCCTLPLQIFHLSARSYCVSTVYGWPFACGTPVRAFWGNWINGAATLCALWTYGKSKVERKPLGWLKTEHAFPGDGTKNGTADERR
jgi:bacteriophage N4 adsorption protein B